MLIKSLVGRIVCSQQKKMNQACRLITYNTSMQAYSELTALLLSPHSTYAEFELAFHSHDIAQQTYLNLFLTTVAVEKASHPDFPLYLSLLTENQEKQSKKSADINYIGYKDKVSILMHACAKGSPTAISTLLLNPNIDLKAADPYGRSAPFYALNNPDQAYSLNILTLLLVHYPDYLNYQSANGQTLLNQAASQLKYSVVELLLKKGANPHNRVKQTGETVAHQVVKNWGKQQQEAVRIIALLIKYGANFDEKDSEGVSVIEAAKKEGFNISEGLSLCSLLERDQSAIEETDNEFDKVSLTTINQQTKIGDSVSELFELQSNICSHQIDFSEFDYQQDSDNDPLPSEEDSELLSCREEEILQKLEQNGPNFEVLSQQISEFSALSEQKHRQAWIVMQPFFRVISKIAEKYYLASQLVGSFATGLWSTYSDIDINLVPLSNNYVNFEDVLDKVYRKLKARRSELNIEDIFISKNKFLSIKLALGARYNNQIIDIGVFHRNNQNRQYVAYVTQAIIERPQIKPLFFAVKKLCETFNLHDQLLGGLKSYTLFLIVESVVRGFAADNIGQLFNHIALYYGFYFEYDFQFDEESMEVVSWPSMRFNLMDPLNPKNNTGGKNTKTQQVQNMFRAAYFSLNQLSSAPYLHQLFDLHHIFD